MVKLYPHQKEAIAKLKPGSILVGGVGSGKSITSLAYYYDDICYGSYERDREPIAAIDLYIITTARKRDSKEWDVELSNFGLSRDSANNPHGIAVVVDSWNNIKKYENVKDAFFIFDEQRVVGSGSWVKAFIKITKSNKWILLSATPGDTWSDYIPVFIANGFYKNRTAFLREHAIFDRFAKYPKIVKYVNTSKLEKFRKSILVTMDFSRTTERLISYVHVDYDRDLYKAAFIGRWNPYLKEPIQDAGQLCHVLRKIVNTDSSRLDQVINLAWIHDRMIIFYNLDSELEILRSLKNNYKLPRDIVVAEWNGHKHEPLPTSERWLYLVQYTAGSEGWNCVETDTVIFYSLNYSYKIMEQASGRIDRINTPYRYLNYYRFVSDSTIDKAILSALENKQTFNELAFANCGH